MRDTATSAMMSQDHSVGPSESRMTRFSLFCVFVVAMTVAVAAIFGCDTTIAAIPSDGAGHNREVPSYVGNYGATAGRTAVNLEVKEASFTAVTFTEPSKSTRAPSARATLVRHASANLDVPAVWVVFTGEVTVSGNSVTATITGVERDGQTLDGQELDEYTDCAITATLGDEFDDEVLDAISRCLGTTDMATVYAYDEVLPSDLIVGTWDIESDHDPDDGFEVFPGVSLLISSSRLRIDRVGGWECSPGEASPSACTILYIVFDVEIGNTTIYSSGLREARVDQDGGTIYVDGDNYSDYFYLEAEGAMSFVINSTRDRMALQGGWGADVYFSRRR